MNTMNIAFKNCFNIQQLASYLELDLHLMKSAPKFIFKQLQPIPNG